MLIFTGLTSEHKGKIINALTKGLRERLLEFQVNLPEA